MSIEKIRFPLFSFRALNDRKNSKRGHATRPVKRIGGGGEDEERRLLESER